MTNQEYITKLLAGLGITEDDITIILLKSGLKGDADVDVDACDKSVYKRMSIVLKGAMQNVTEGGYSISWNVEAVKLFYSALCDEIGAENVLVGRPKIRNRSNVW